MLIIAGIAGAAMLLTGLLGEGGKFKDIRFEVLDIDLPTIGETTAIDLKLLVENPTGLAVVAKNLNLRVFVWQKNKWAETLYTALPSTIRLEPNGGTTIPISATLNAKGLIPFYGQSIGQIINAIQQGRPAYKLKFVVSGKVGGVPINKEIIKELRQGRLQGLGLVASGYRHISDGREHGRYFNLGNLAGKNILIKKHPSLLDTVKTMHAIGKKTTYQTKAIARRLQADSLDGTLGNIWRFLYGHFQFRKDEDGTEQLRTPIRSWADRKSGIDCDCYSLFISSILQNMGIPHAFRVTGYGKGWQHVYVVVPKDGRPDSLAQRAAYHVVDCVADSYDYEVPFKQKKDFYIG